jgi:hypothetical protein
MRENIVKLNRIESSVDLDTEIERLTLLKEQQEYMIKESLKSFSHMLSPGTVIKKTLFKMSEDEEVKQSALKTSLNMGAQFVLDKIMLRKGIGIKSYLLNMALKRVASFLITKNKIPSFNK